MTLNGILDILRSIVDITLVWVIFYYILKNIKNNPSTYPILLDFYCIYEDLDYPHKYNSWKDIVDKF